ncbi:MAG: hypothetical protein ACR2IX_09835 [Limnohabitans sp.]
MSTTAKKAPIKTTTRTAAKKAPQAAAKKPVVKKAVAKPATKPVTRAASKTASAKPTKPAKPVKPAKVKKPKLVRDSFTIPKDEYVVIDSLKLRAGKLGQSVKKSELLRAGVKALAAMTDIQFKAALSNVPTIKTGRPKSAK